MRKPINFYVFGFYFSDNISSTVITKPSSNNDSNCYLIQYHKFVKKNIIVSVLNEQGEFYFIHTYSRYTERNDCTYIIAILYRYRV